jgi:3-oxoacyl-[acyl-carrier-protein] synthase II
VVGSSRGQQQVLEQFARQGFDEKHWLDALPQAAAIAVAQQLQTQAPVLAPMAACATGVWAIAQGMELLRTQQCTQVLVGAVEAPITPLTLAGFQQMGALAQTGAYPFDRRREGLVLGEGAVLLVLETANQAQQRQAPKLYGRLLSFGLSTDAYHVSAPDPKQRGAIAAVNTCLHRSQLEPTQVDYIHAHGTGTRLNDHHEAELIQALFPRAIAVSSTKGATGHTLGASGAFGAAFSLMALHHQRFPPCVGLNQPAFALNFVPSPDRADLNSLPFIAPQTLQNALSFSFGFGGQNAVLALARY